MGLQGQIQDFPKGGGLRPAIRNAGGGAVHCRPDTKSGGGCCPLKARYENGGGGVAVRRFRPDAKSGEGGGGEAI